MTLILFGHVTVEKRLVTYVSMAFCWCCCRMDPGGQLKRDDRTEILAQINGSLCLEIVQSFSSGAKWRAWVCLDA